MRRNDFAHICASAPPDPRGALQRRKRPHRIRTCDICLIVKYEPPRHLPHDPVRGILMVAAVTPCWQKVSCSAVTRTSSYQTPGELTSGFSLFISNPTVSERYGSSASHHIWRKRGDAHIFLKRISNRVRPSDGRSSENPDFSKSLDSACHSWLQLPVSLAQK